MSVPEEFVVHVVGYEWYIYECTHIIMLYEVVVVFKF